MAPAADRDDDNVTMIYPAGYEPKITKNNDDNENDNNNATVNHKIRNQLLNSILQSKPPASRGVLPVSTEIFDVMASRRSTRKFDQSRPVEPEKVDKIIAAADTAPTAGNYQGFEVYLVRGIKRKQELVAACNNQPYVNAPLVLAFCKNPARVKFDFDEEILRKFAIQDATLAAGYSQLAAQALGLSSIWIGMFDETAVMRVLGTDLVPSSILCVGYPKQNKYPKPRRNLEDLVHVLW